MAGHFPPKQYQRLAVRVCEFPLEEGVCSGFRNHRDILKRSEVDVTVSPKGRALRYDQAWNSVVRSTLTVTLYRTCVPGSIAMPDPQSGIKGKKMAVTWGDK